MRVAPRSCGAGLRLALFVLAAAAVLVGCAALSSGGREEPSPSAFLARQYLARGRAAWAAGNEENARFLLGRAVELDPTNADAVAFWSARWPLDSLPPPARAARDAALAEGRPEEVAVDSGAEASPAAAAAPPVENLAPAAGARPPDAEVSPGADEGEDRAPAESGREAPDEARADGDRALLAAPPGARAELPEAGAEVAGPGAEAEATARAEVEDPARVAEAAESRARFDQAAARGDARALEEAGQGLLTLRPHVLPDVHRVLGAWVEARVDPPATEARIRDVLGSLEFGDRAYLVGRPEDVEEAAYLRRYRGRFLDLLGWSAFLRGDLSQAEAALRSAETEINLRGPGDVSHLRHLAAFYERKRNLTLAERYAIAAAARDTTGSGEVRAAAARLWVQRRGGRSGLDARLSEEALRVRREERAAAIAGRLYAPLPVFRARRTDGRLVTDESLRGRVTILVLWEADCADCRRLLADLAADPPELPPAGPRVKPGAPVEILAVDVGDPPAGAPASPSPPGLPAGIPGATPERPGAFANALGADRLPLTVLVEPAGFIQYRHAGYPADPQARGRWKERLRWQVESLASLRPEPSPRK